MVGRTLQSAGRLHRSAAARHQLITDRVRMDGSVTVDELVRATGVSRMTVHRDLDALETEGVLRKVRGGATATRSSIFESDLQYRLTTAVEAKAAIGDLAQVAIDAAVREAKSLGLSRSDVHDLIDRVVDRWFPEER